MAYVLLSMVYAYFLSRGGVRCVVMDKRTVLVKHVEFYARQITRSTDGGSAR